MLNTILSTRPRAIFSRWQNQNTLAARFMCLASMTWPPATLEVELGARGVLPVATLISRPIARPPHIIIDYWIGPWWPNGHIDPTGSNCNSMRVHCWTVAGLLQALGFLEVLDSFCTDSRSVPTGVGLLNPHKPCQPWATSPTYWSHVKHTCSYLVYRKAFCSAPRHSYLEHARYAALPAWARTLTLRLSKLHVSAYPCWFARTGAPKLSRHNPSCWSRERADLRHVAMGNSCRGTMVGLYTHMFQFTSLRHCSHSCWHTYTTSMYTQVGSCRHSGSGMW